MATHPVIKIGPFFRCHAHEGFRVPDYIKLNKTKTRPEEPQIRTDRYVDGIELRQANLFRSVPIISAIAKASQGTFVPGTTIVCTSIEQITETTAIDQPRIKFRRAFLEDYVLTFGQDTGHAKHAKDFFDKYGTHFPMESTWGLVESALAFQPTRENHEFSSLLPKCLELQLRYANNKAPISLLKPIEAAFVDPNPQLSPVLEAFWAERCYRIHDFAAPSSVAFKPSISGNLISIRNPRAIIQTALVTLPQLLNPIAQSKQQMSAIALVIRKRLARSTDIPSQIKRLHQRFESRWQEYMQEASLAKSCGSAGEAVNFAHGIGCVCQKGWTGPDCTEKIANFFFLDQSNLSYPNPVNPDTPPSKTIMFGLSFSGSLEGNAG